MNIAIDKDTAVLAEMLERVNEPLDYESILSIIDLIPTSMGLFFSGVKIGDPINIIRIEDPDAWDSIIETAKKLRISPGQFVKGCLSLMIVGGGLNDAL